ncbi:DUF1659 domain-containing protein [Desulfosporosinus sp. BICA1-9]|uniref:DUF1659 domain-containing protein n=1 Tax=Desulfosporosinus sp. BICA1-9 TaxID=1531958 RepID=UPI00054B0301|nr:DUF1659 domain-containing protein [Desulfosporosinus sp. BICA1-9]KJS90448.1 MAG: hypothetical protein JL57_01295 [Desulfosporosinus sp. BICA1-9]HBW38470.1 DUF1659 domain-containing protein [Desulfosporosinus sp.]
MPIISSGVETEMVVRYQTGTTAEGSPVIRQKSFSGLKMDVSDEDLYEVATTLFNLLEYPLVSVTRNNRFDLAVE